MKSWTADASRRGHGEKQKNRFAIIRLAAGKSFDFVQSFRREKAVSLRMGEKGFVRANEFDVPHPIEFDDDLWMIEMTIVSRPFIVDFAGATLDRRGVRFDDLDVVDERLPNEQDEFESD